MTGETLELRLWWLVNGFFAWLADLLLSLLCLLLGYLLGSSHCRGVGDHAVQGLTCWSERWSDNPRLDSIKSTGV